jgi:hypothetical protein
MCLWLEVSQFSQATCFSKPVLPCSVTIQHHWHLCALPEAKCRCILALGGEVGILFPSLWHRVTNPSLPLSMQSRQLGGPGRNSNSWACLSPSLCTCSQWLYETWYGCHATRHTTEFPTVLFTSLCLLKHFISSKALIQHWWRGRNEQLCTE